ncbi:MAG: murein biosynthesis integral membrane protein MurJ [Gemmatimonadales bacterium]
MASRLVGLVRQKVIAHYLGQSTDSADALATAFRIPNVLQNLLGEGALSASFIPEYAQLRKQGRLAEADQLRNAVLGLLAAVVTVVVAIGVVFTPALVDVLVPGFAGPRRDLTVELVRILFPGVGLLVLSAWCLGVLNAHRRFFLSYAAPVVWNLAIIAATLLAATSANAERIVIWTAWGAVVGSLLQLLVQLPTVIRVSGPIVPSLDRRAPATRAVASRFGPAVLSRGVVQIGAFVDTWLASWLPLGSVAALANAQLLYTLPISLFGMSIAASSLPAMAEEAAGEFDPVAFRASLDQRLAQVAYFVVPSAIGFILLGHQVGGLIFQSGAFTATDVRWLWGTLAAAAVGLLPQAWGRLLASAHYAFGDTATPLRFATTRLLLAAGVGSALALFGPELMGIDPKWGTAGIALGTALAGILEWALLARSIDRRVGPVGLGLVRGIRLWGAALAGAAAAWAALLGLEGRPVLVQAPIALLIFGASYLVATSLLGVPEAAALRRRLSR